MEKAEALTRGEGGNGDVRHVAVVGAGAAGFEVACAIAGALDEVGISYSHWAWRLQNWIDRRFMNDYEKLVD